MRRRSKESERRTERSYTSIGVKAASHPTRQLILKALEESGRSTVDLEQITNENRYNLYHHLSVLEDAGLVASRIADGKVKEFSLVQPERPETVYLQLDRSDPNERKQLDTLLTTLNGITKGKIPHLKKVTSARLMLSYPWSPDEEG